MYATLKYEVSESILTLTLNRPQRRNAVTTEMLRELIAAFDAADADDGIRAIIVTGEGNYFCAGADLVSGGQSFDFANQEDGTGFGGSPLRDDGSIDWSHEGVRDAGGRVNLRIFSCLKPVIAAVNGPAVGYGASMLLPMDIRIATTGARFGYVFARRGILLDGCASWFLPRIVGVSQALEWAMSGDVFSAQEALDGGLVKKLCSDEELLSVARSVAHKFIDGSAPVSVALTRQMIWKSLGASHPMETHRIDSKLIYARGASPDAHEGVSSFLEKRKAKFPCKISHDMPETFPWWDEPEYF